MGTYDKAKIGKCISWIGDHFVYEYGDDKVIKFSKFHYLLGKEKSTKKFLSDYAISKKYFGDYILETELLTSPDGKKLAVVQPKIKSHFLTRKDLSYEHIKTQFNEIVSIFDRMIKAEGPYIDLIGHEGVRHRCVGNIFVTPEKRLVIFDVLLFTPKDFSTVHGKILYLIFHSVRWLQSRKLKSFQQLK